MEYLELIDSLRFYARDFKLLRDKLDIFSKLNEIEFGYDTAFEVLRQVLLRIDDEKKLQDK